MSMDIRGKYKPYPAYKDSGVEWLEKVPEHWLPISIKNLDPYNSELAQTGPFGAQLHAEDYIDDGVPLILIKNVNNLKIDDTDIPKISKEDANRLCQYTLKEGDIVFSCVGSIGRIAPVTKREESWLISGQMLRLRIKNKNLNNSFFLYALSSRLITDAISYYSVGSTRESINTDILKNLFLSIPPLSEQSSISTFLDRETAKIDKLITEQERLVGLLQEKRIALISHAVTKGLNPNVPMKDSSIEWLGEVPAHWAVKPIKRVASSNDDVLSEKTPDEYEIEYIDISSVNEIEGIIKTEKMIFKNAPSRARRLVKDGDIIVSTVRTYLKAIAFIKLPNENLVVSTGFAVIRPNKNLLPGFAAYLFKAHYLIELIISKSVGASYPAINSHDLVALKIALPSLEEQAAIAAFLDCQSAKVDTLITKSHKAIAFLKERRTALISAAVTGKIDVRDTIN